MERRTAPRLTRQLPVRVAHAEFETTNLSATGLQFSCPSMWQLRIQTIIDAGEVSADVELPEGEEITFHGKVVYASKIDDEYLIGVEFTGFDGDGESTWQGFLAKYVRE